MIWNNSDFVGGVKFEEFSCSWYLSVDHLKELRMYYPRVVFPAGTDWERWGCSPKWGELMRQSVAYPRGQNFLVLPMTQFAADVEPYIYNFSKSHLKRHPEVLMAWEREFKRTAELACFHCTDQSYPEFLNYYKRYAERPLTKVARRRMGARSGQTGAGTVASPGQTEAGPQAVVIQSAAAAPFVPRDA